MSKLLRIICLTLIIFSLAGRHTPVFAASSTYYVSSSTGNDTNNGLTEGAALKTIAKVNGLNLQAGDRVLFKCGDTWRGEMLSITKSGASGSPISFGSYPAGCGNKPIISGAQPINGWTTHSGSIYVANLAAGANAGKFGYGINQLFRGSERLLLGRWPNLGAADGGYSTIDAAPSSTQITDNQLPAVNWTGAMAHIKGMRWYILNRQVTADSGSTLTLNAWGDCWGGSCTGWGFFLNNHLATLDSDGEWYYDTAAKKVYLYSAGGAPANGEIEGSVILKNDDRAWGGITLGEDLGASISYVTVENLETRRWFRHGIALPTNFANTEPHHLIVRNNTISDVDSKGISLAAWVYSATDGRPDGWRGGYALNVNGNAITRANSMGIDLYSRNSTFSRNTISEIGMIENLGAAGMGCSLNSGGGSCTEDGDGLRIKIDQPADTGNNNTITENHFDHIAYNGMDIFGNTNTFQNNIIQNACFAKGDCGGVRTFGRDNLASSPVHDLVFDGNIIINTTGNTDGCHSDFDALFGFGLYIDNYSRSVQMSGNTIIGSTVHGILLQNSTGAATGNTLYNNGSTYPYGGGQVYVGGSPAQLNNHANNILYSLNPNAWTLALDDPSRLGASDNNAFFSPYKAAHINANGAKTLAQWKTFSGKDAASGESWFSLAPGEPNNAQVFYNDTNAAKNFDLGDLVYRDLDQNIVTGTLTLQPYQSKILVLDTDPALNPPKVLSVTRSNPSPTTLTSVSFDVVFSEPVSGVDTADFSLTLGSDLSGAFVNSVSGAGTTYNVTVSTGSGSGSLRLNVLDDDSIQDAQSTPLSGAFNTGQAYMVRPQQLTLYTVAARDGWLLESNETSSQGGSVNASAATFRLGDEAQDRQYRTILSFNTAALPDNAQIVSARLRIRQSGTPTGQNPFAVLGNLLVDIRKGTFGASGLSASDFQAAASLAKAASFGKTPTNYWYTATLAAKTWGYLNKTGPTEFRLYFGLDDNNDNGADYLKFFSGEAVNTKPELLIQYVQP